jgi:lipid A 3-O-deacylase
MQANTPFHRKFVRFSPALLLLLLPLPHMALANPITQIWQQYSAAWENGKPTYAVDIDNDSLLLRDKDGLFSSGAEFSVSAVQLTGGKANIAVWCVGQQIYTPTDINLPPARVGPPNHPYAGFLFTGWFAQSYQADGSYLKSSIDIGCIGPCSGAEQTQKSLHRLINEPQPQGWSRQVKNEAGVVLGVGLAPARFVLGQHADLQPALQARFGNIFTDATVGGLLRLGQLGNLPGDKTAHLYTRLDVRAVAYDATLQGGYFSKNNPHTVQPKKFVGEAELGYMWRGAQFGLNAGVVRRSNEIRDFPNSQGAQSFARLQFSYTP